LPSPPPPSPPSPASSETRYRAEMHLNAGGTVESYARSDLHKLARIIAHTVGLASKDAVELDIRAGSVVITARIEERTEAKATKILSRLRSSMGTATAASSTLGISVLSAPLFRISSFQASGKRPDDAALSADSPTGSGVNGALVAAVTVAVAVLAGLFCWLRRCSRSIGVEQGSGSSGSSTKRGKRDAARLIEAGSVASDSSVFNASEDASCSLPASAEGGELLPTAERSDDPQLTSVGVRRDQLASTLQDGLELEQTPDGPHDVWKL